MTDVTLRPGIAPILPGAYSEVDASQLEAANQGPTTPIIAFLGPALGGPPNVPLKFTNGQAARTALRGQDLELCVRTALGIGATPVKAVRVGAGVLQASLSLAGTAGNPILLTSKDYGSWNNLITILVEANNKITLTFTDPLTGVSYKEPWAPGSSATAAQVCDYINGNVPGVNGSRFITASTQSGTMPLTTAAAAPLANGSDGTVSTGDWTTALTALENEDVDIVCVMSGSATIHAQAIAHCAAMSDPKARSERVAVLGGVLGENVAAVISRAQSLQAGGNTARAQLVYPGVTLRDRTGTPIGRSPFIAAALVAAVHAIQSDPATSILHHIIPGAVDVEASLSRLPGSDLEQLLAANVSPICRARSGSGFWIEDSLTLWATDKTYRDVSTVRGVDACAQGLRDALEAEAGKKGTQASSRRVESIANEELDRQARTELIADHRPVSVEVTPDATLVTAPVMPVGVQKYIEIVVALQPLNAAAPTLTAGALA